MTLKEKVEQLERRVKELEAQPKEYHYHYYYHQPYYVPYSQPQWLPYTPTWTVTTAGSGGTYYGDLSTSCKTITNGGSLNG